MTEVRWTPGRVPLAVTPGTRAVVAVHDPGSPPGARRRWLDSARRSWGAWSYAQRGHAPSAWVAGGVYRASDLAVDLVRVLRELVGEPCLLAGQGAGGLVAVLAAAAAPGLVSGLHLLPADGAGGWGADLARVVTEGAALNRSWLGAVSSAAPAVGAGDDPLLACGPAERLHKDALGAAAAWVRAPWWAGDGHALRPWLPAGLRAPGPLLMPAELPGPVAGRGFG